jgi:uncharacterized membrane protein
MAMGYGYGASSFGSSLVSIFVLVIFLLFAVALMQSVSGASSEDGGGGVSLGGDRVSVVRLQVGLLGIARSLQADLDAIADKADTSSPEGLQYVLQETVLTLLRHPDYCVYGNSGNRTVVGVEAAEASFNELSMEERGKFEAETLVNVNARKKSAAPHAPSASSDGMTNEFIVVTILVAADAPLKLPPVTSAEELKTALKRLGAVRVDALQAVEIMWTPQEDGDTLTQAELSRNYPLLNSL